MEEFVRHLLENASGGGAYALVFGVLLACGLGVPLPEDVSLITGGYLVHLGNARLYLMMLTGYLGIIVGDSIIFFAGTRFGQRVGQKPGGLIGRVITPDKIARVRALFAKYGEKIVFIARFMPGVRSVTYFTAGAAHMKYWHFLAWDGIAALISAPVFVFLGYKFGGELEELIDNVRKGQTRVLLALAALLAAYIAFRVWRARNEKAEAKVLPADTKIDPVIHDGPPPVEPVKAPGTNQS